MVMPRLKLAVLAVGALPQFADETELRDPDFRVAFALGRNRDTQGRDDGEHDGVGSVDGEQCAHFRAVVDGERTRPVRRPSSRTMAFEPVTETMRPIEWSARVARQTGSWRGSCMVAHVLDGLARQMARSRFETCSGGLRLRIPSCVREATRRLRCPCPSRDRISIWPPCSSTSALAIGRPRPVPSRQRGGCRRPDQRASARPRFLPRSCRRRYRGSRIATPPV